WLRRTSRMRRIERPVVVGGAASAHVAAGEAMEAAVNGVKLLPGLVDGVPPGVEQAEVHAVRGGGGIRAGCAMHLVLASDQRIGADAEAIHRGLLSFLRPAPLALPCGQYRLRCARGCTSPERGKDG